MLICGHILGFKLSHVDCPSYRYVGRLKRLVQLWRLFVWFCFILDLHFHFTPHIQVFQSTDCSSIHILQGIPKGQIYIFALHLMGSCRANVPIWLQMFIFLFYFLTDVHVFCWLMQAAGSPDPQQMYLPTGWV